MMKKILCISMSLFVVFSALAQDTTYHTKAVGYYMQGKTLFEGADYTQSTQELQKALPIFEQTKDMDMSLLCRGMICHNQLRQGDINTAIENMDKIFTQAQQVMSPEVRAILYNIISEAYLNKGRLDLAQEYLEKSLEIFTELRQGTSPDLANVYNNLGLVSWNTGKWDEALDYQFRSLNIRQKIFGLEHPGIAASYNDLGLVYSSKGDLDKALAYYRDALKIYEKIYGTGHVKVANAYINIAIIQRRQQNYLEALQNLEKALQIWEANPQTNQARIAFGYSNIGQVYLEQDEYLLALEYQKRSLGLYRSAFGNKHPEIANTYNLIGRTLLKRGDYRDALENFQQALMANVSSFDQADYYLNPDISSYYNADILLSSLHLKAQALENVYLNKTLKLKDIQTALSCLESCDLLIEKIRILRHNKNDKIRLGEIAAEVYEDAIRISLNLSEMTLKSKFYQEKAFYFSEKSKSAVLLSAINDTDAKQFANIPADLLTEERQIKEDIAFLEQELAKGPSAEQEKIYRDDLFTLNQKYQRFIEGLEQKFPDYYNLKYNVRTIRITDIQQILPENTALLSYFIAPKTQRIYLFKISKNTFQIEDIPQIEKFESFLTGIRNAIQFRSLKSFYRSAYTLYKQLFPNSIHRDIQKLVIIPDGRLGSIPYEALIMEDPERKAVSENLISYVIQKYEVSYNYSATLFAQTIQKKSSQTAENKSILLCAPINFSKAKLASLPGTSYELERIEELFAQNNLPTHVLEKEKAEEETLKNTDLSKYTYIHLATHGTVDEVNPELSRIYLFQKEDTTKEDGQLYAGEIYNLRFQNPLVILSACQTGLGKISRGEGIIGLSRALLYAGAKDILVSLWSVADQSTSELMVDFYTHILKNESGQQGLSQALREAKLQMIAHSEYKNPYFWAPFILIGN
ncbi:MAG: CHAT domain-containing tetratricopeptide repeat protein [Microscillaceae bacterium]|nr:CHAT domain-containing tetratricopeptide repeat protein [Microscillaceae bacterium]